MAEENFRKYLKEIHKHLDLGDSSEHTHRSALGILIESLGKNIVATNEPSHIAVGAPDFNVRRNKLLIGHIECKDVGVNLQATLKTDQLKRYRENLPNLILTDYINFIWFRNGKEIDKAHIARRDSKGRLKLDTEELPRLNQLLENFLKVEPPEIGDPRKLAEEMARPARMIRDIIREIFAKEEKQGPLHSQLAAFQEVLLPDLSPHYFADMYAQTIAYGLFAARTELDLKTEEFTWRNALYHLPKSNPFLRSLFSRVVGPDNEEPRIREWIEQLALLLARSDMYHILEGFGKKTRQEDPVVHFYETFIGAYDPKMKKSRGIYYTPQPVVSYIVRSIDHLLKEKFGLKKGLADDTLVKVVEKNKKGEEVERIVPKVQILDPACGTGSFLLEVVRLIQDRIPAAAWPDYVRRYLLPRLFGFELLVAPYTIAHLKLGLYLKETGFEFDENKDERLGVYLTNALEPEVHGQIGLTGLAPLIVKEGIDSQKIKKQDPIMVVLGNPPYQGHSANRSWKEVDEEYRGPIVTKKGKVKETKKKIRVRTFIGELLQDYYYVDGKPLGERNPKWLQDDYVKFLRFAQWRIEQTRYGIVGMITNHGYLDNPTFRGMRQQLMQSFNEIHVLNLHGNTKKKEVCPDGSKDENVFDIQQGVAIGLFTKEEGKKKTPKVKHSEFWGLREIKYAELAEKDIENVKKEKLKPSTPFYLFVPQDIHLRVEYEKGWKITEIMPVNVLGFQTHRDHFSIDFDQKQLRKRIAEMQRNEISDHNYAQKYNIKDNRDWKLAEARKVIKKDPCWESKLVLCAYRPFDLRPCYFSEVAMDYPRRELLDHVVGKDNLCLLSSRQQSTVGYRHSWVSKRPPESCVVSIRSREGNQVFPLYLYPTPKKTGQQGLHDEEIKPRKPNLDPDFIDELEKKVKLTFIQEGQGDLKRTFGPEDVFYYIYAVLHSPTYRKRYAEFLKIDFPRVPLTSSRPLFRKLVKKGKVLTELHLLESAKLADHSALSKIDLEGPVDNKNEVEKLRYDEKHKRVYINKGQYFSGVEPAVWNFHVGGYQVCHKWLKDRKGRRLNYDDITHYQKIVIALRETIKLMESIDKAIGEWPIC